MKGIKFLGISIGTLFILLIIWFFTCFLLGYASNSSHQKEIWIAFIITIIIHFFVTFLIYRKSYESKISIWYLAFNVLMYFISAWYFYYNT